MTLFLGGECSTTKKKNEIRTYLEQNGIIGKITEIYDKILKANVKPENPLDFIRDELGAKPIAAEELEHLEHELDGARCEIRRLRSILKELGNEDADEDSILGHEDNNMDEAVVSNKREHN